VGAIMARLYLMDYKKQPLIVSNDEAVGLNAPNKRLDVMLVQFLMNVTGRHNDRSWAWFMDWKYPLPTIDGICGKQTQDWIWRFQEHLKSKRIFQDGRVDPIKNGISDTSVGGPLTIYMLNVAYYNTFGDNAIEHIVDHARFPREVARTFMMHGRAW
jgi:hypothetical protein